MSTDNFTEAARAEAERRYNRIVRRNKTADEWLDEGRASGFTSGAEWARTHLAAQEPTEGEIEAAALMICIDMDGPDGPPETKACKACINIARRALDSVRAARRDEEAR